MHGDHGHFKHADRGSCTANRYRGGDGCKRSDTRGNCRRRRQYAGDPNRCGGRYSIQASQGETMVFSIIGYTRQTVTVGSSAMINITMVENASELGEVVVTALGIRRERKSMGYAFQEIKGEDLVDRREKIGRVHV